MNITKFEDLDCWREARMLTQSIYAATGNDFFRQDYELAEQTKRAATSIMANIAEGFSRQNDHEFSRFLIISKASASELQSYLYVALDQGYIDRIYFQSIYNKLENIYKGLSSLIQHLKADQ